MVVLEIVQERKKLQMIKCDEGTIYLVKWES